MGRGGSGSEGSSFLGVSGKRSLAATSRLPPLPEAGVNAAREKEAEAAGKAAERAAGQAAGMGTSDLDARTSQTTSVGNRGSQKSSGQPLDPATREEMESRLGHDFSRVRVHADGAAAARAASAGARAFTVDADVTFAQGRFAPQTSEGRGLLAHELTHVVQQAREPQVAGLMQRSEDEPGAAAPPAATTAAPAGVVSTDLERLREVLADWEAKLASQGAPSPFTTQPVEGTAYHRIGVKETAWTEIEKEAKRVNEADDAAARGAFGQDRVYPAWVLRVASMARSDLSFDLRFVSADALVVPREEKGETKRVSLNDPTGDAIMARVKELGRQAKLDQISGNNNAVAEAQEQLAKEQEEGRPTNSETRGITSPTSPVSERVIEKTLELLMKAYDEARAAEKAKALEADGGSRLNTEGRPWAQKSREQARSELEALLKEGRSKNVESSSQAAVRVFLDQRVGQVGGGGATQDLLNGDVNLGELVAHELAIHGAVYLPGSRATWLIPMSDTIFISRGLDRVQQAAYKKVQSDHGVDSAMGQHHWVLEKDLEFEAPRPASSTPAKP